MDMRANCSRATVLFSWTDLNASLVELRLVNPRMPIPTSSTDRNPITKTSRDLILIFVSISITPFHSIQTVASGACPASTADTSSTIYRYSVQHPEVIDTLTLPLPPRMTVQAVRILPTRRCRRLQQPTSATAQPAPVPLFHACGQPV